MKALCESSPQARHHFTRLDQVEQLVRASEANPETGFIARLLALRSLPRTNPGHQLQYKRVNGPYTLIMTAVGQTGLPFGNLPRLPGPRNAPLTASGSPRGSSSLVYETKSLLGAYESIFHKTPVIRGSFPG